MTMLELYLIVSLLIFGFLAWIWNKNSGPNLFLKVLLIGMVIWSLVICYQLHVKEQLDYIEIEKAKIELQKEALEEGLEIK